MRNKWTMRVFAALSCVSICGAVPGEQKLPPALEAGKYPAHVTQAGVTVAADPYLEPAQNKVFRVDYLQYNFVPIRIIVTNDTDAPVSLNDVRILLLLASGSKENAAEPEDVERRVSNVARRGVDIPIGPVTIHKQGKSSDKKIDKDFDEFEYSTLTVAPHTTNAGFLWYDVQGMGQHPLNGAVLEFREIRDGSGKQMFAFDVPLGT